MDTYELNNTKVVLDNNQLSGNLAVFKKIKYYFVNSGNGWNNVTSKFIIKDMKITIFFKENAVSKDKLNSFKEKYVDITVRLPMKYSEEYNSISCSGIDIKENEEQNNIDKSVFDNVF